MPQRKPLTKNRPIPSSKLKKAVLYVRVSTGRQAVEGFSLDAQHRYGREYVDRKGFLLASEFTEAQTASEIGRKEFAKMLAFVQANDVDVIICENTDRLYRNYEDYVRLGKLNTELHFYREGIVLTKDSRSHERLMADLKVTLAKNYSDNLREQAKKGMLEKAQQGIWPSVAPIGYINISHGHRRTIMPDPERAELITHLFTEFATGRFSLKTAVKYANEIGLTTRKNRKLSAAHLYTILNNPLYRGIIQWSGEEYRGSHTTLTDDQTWQKVSDVLTGRKFGASFGSKDYLYKGMFTCGDCGCSISPYTAKGKYIYYACGGFKGCVRKGVRQEVIDAAVVDFLKGITIRPEVVEIIKQALKESSKELTDTKAPITDSLEKEKARLTRRLTQLYQDKLDGEIENEQYREFRHQWTQELRQIEDRLSKMQIAEEQFYGECVGILQLASEAFRTFAQATDEERRELLSYLLSNSQIVAGTVVLNAKSWFKTMLEINRGMALNGADDTQLANWLPLLDDFQTLRAA